MKKLNIRTDRRGVTLVEVIVTFLLIGIFMIAATAVLSSSLRVYARVKADSHAQVVCDTLLDRIEGELAGASASNMLISTTAEQMGDNKIDDVYDGDKPCYITDKSFTADNRCIYFVNKQGSPVYMYAEQYDSNNDNPYNGNLVIHYYSVGNQEATDWNYDDDSLMNYNIRSLTFTRLSKYVIKVDLVIVSADGRNVYSLSRTVKCFRLSNNTSSVQYGYIQTDAFRLWQKTQTNI